MASAPERRSLRSAGVDGSGGAGSAPVAGVEQRAVVLVEGASDQAALEVLAGRRGRALAADGVLIVAMGGATNVGKHLQRYGPQGLDVRLAGLCDAGADEYFGRCLERVGFGVARSRAQLEALGFYACDADLEDELIRALGTRVVEEIIESAGELPALRSLQRQPAQRGRSTHDQLHRFMGSRSGRKLQYARLLVDALDLARVPRALDAVLEHVQLTSCGGPAGAAASRPSAPGSPGPAPRT
jgi:hypothetical protein